jgi:prepilin-type N-terminal cleavage/methylation domain-containing protein
MFKTNTKKGFTLIEILVVVAIISILASVVVAALVDARAGARNSKRNELARQYVTSLGLYYGEYGSYPTGGCTVGEENGGNCSSISYVCLGDSYPEDSCFVRGKHDENLLVNSQISEFAPGTPSSSRP